jgi:phosphohistidine phosphatase
MKAYDLILMRHGKAEKNGASDHERRLADRGLQQSLANGKSLHKLFETIDRAIVSDATRTRQTLAQVLLEATISTTILEAKLYTINNQRDFLDAISTNLEHKENSLLIIGHNPTISSLATYYTSQDFDLGTGEFIVATIEASDWVTALESGEAWSLKYPR